MPSKLGDKYNRIYVPAKSFITTSEGILQGETGILPTDCRSTPVVVIMNVLVNDVPHTIYLFYCWQTVPTGIFIQLHRNT